ncbi:MAG TPA: PilN domain-containing protein [Candidatus Saccharimonadales bacterium]|nr:PilN domain-containing protein [Candidatus Saccharimonadales bacterium]
MINLISPQAKKQLRAARVNRTLGSYFLILLGAAMLLGGIFAVGFYTTNVAMQQANQLTAENLQKAEAYAKVRTQAEAFSKDLNVAKTILASDVRFSKLIGTIAAVIPKGVILTNLTLTAAQNPNAPLTINARAKNFDDGIALKNNLEASPIFENVKLINASTSPEVSAYPVTLSLSVQFTKAKVGS